MRTVLDVSRMSDYGDYICHTHDEHMLWSCF